MLAAVIVGLGTVVLAAFGYDSWQLHKREKRPADPAGEQLPPAGHQASCDGHHDGGSCATWHQATLRPDVYAPWLSGPRVCGQRLTLAERVKDHYWAAETRVTLALEAASWSEWRRTAL